VERLENVSERCASHTADLSRLTPLTVQPVATAVATTIVAFNMHAPHHQQLHSVVQEAMDADTLTTK